MTSGEQLKINLGLKNFRSVRITRLLGVPIPLYNIWYDSARPSFPVMINKIKSDPNVAMLRDVEGKNIRQTPPIDIENFNGSPRNAYFILIDVAGQRLMNKDLIESVTLDDLKNSGSASIDKYRKLRNKETGTENRVAKLVDVRYSGGNLTFSWLTIPTDDQDFPDRPIYNADNTDNFEIKIDPSKTYELEIEIIDFQQWLDTYPAGESIKAKDIKDIFDVSYVKVWSSSPSFHWQGFNFKLSNLDGAIYPTNIADKQWRNIHGDALVDKHLLGLINGIKFWYGPMASKATSFLKKKNLL